MCSEAETRKIMKEEVSDRLERYKEENDRQHKEIMSLVESNSATITRIDENTQGIINLWKDTQAVIRFNKGISRAAKWVASLSVVAWVIHWFSDHFSWTS